MTCPLDFSLGNTKMSKEWQEQCALFDWIRYHPHIEPYAIHIANERACTPKQGAHLKRMGVKAGVSDVFIAIPTESYNGIWIELKAKGGRPTKNQINFMYDMSEQGYATAICFGADEAIQVIQQYLG